jgi:hypothetical protein
MSEKARRRAGVQIALTLAALSWAGPFACEAAAQAAAPAPQPAQVAAQDGDCGNARYQALLQTPFATMGKEEFGDFLLMDAECRAEERTRAGTTAICAHKRYADLLAAKKPADMTEREYNYFVAVDRECAGQADAPAPATRQPSGLRQLLTGGAVLVAIIVTALASVN